MLLVTLFAPASQLSAAAALAALYYFVLAHQVTYNHFSFACVLTLVHTELKLHAWKSWHAQAVDAVNCSLCSVCWYWTQLLPAFSVTTSRPETLCLDFMARTSSASTECLSSIQHKLFLLVLDAADTCSSFGNKCKGPMQADFDAQLILAALLATKLRVPCRQTLTCAGAKDRLWSAFSSPSLPK